MLLRSLLIIFFSVLLNSTAFAQDEVCARFASMPTKVEVVSISKPVSYDFSKSSSEIAALGNDAPSGSKTHGLTYAVFELLADVKFAMNPVNGGFCVVPVLVELKIGYTTFNVYVDHIYSKDSCPWRVTLAHENQHVGFDNQVLGEFMPKFQQSAQKAILDASFPRLFLTEEAAKKTTADVLKQALNSVSEKMKSKRDDLNGSIDTFESYMQTAEECSQW